MKRLGGRRGRVWASCALALVVVGGGALAHGLLGGTDAPGCDRLLENRHIQWLLGDDEERDCTALGRELRVELVGDRPGWHALPRRQAMEATLKGISREAAGREDIRTHPDLRRPVAEALVAYRYDLSVLLGFDDRYDETFVFPEEGKDRIAVPAEDLSVAMQAVSEDPKAYAVLRSAMALRCAEEFVSADEKTVRAAFGGDGEAAEELLLLAKRCGSVLGWLDGIADEIVERLGEGSTAAEEWHRDAVTHTTRLETGRPSPSPSLDAALVTDIVETWKERAAEGSAEGYEFERQPGELVSIWADEAGSSESSLAERLRDGAAAGTGISVSLAVHASRCAQGDDEYCE